MAFIRKIKTASGATAVQIAYKSQGQIVKIEHIGSAHNNNELSILIEVAKQKLIGNQKSLFPFIEHGDVLPKLGLKKSLSLPETRCGK